MLGPNKEAIRSLVRVEAQTSLDFWDNRWH